MCAVVCQNEQWLRESEKIIVRDIENRNLIRIVWIILLFVE